MKRAESAPLMNARSAPGPRPEARYRRDLSPLGALSELWRARSLLRVLAERELRARYKQAILGSVWAVIAPVALMIVFSLFVRRVTTVRTHGAPYALFTYLGLLPWTFFATSLTNGGQSLIVQQPLLNKIKCPREVFPLSSLVVAGFGTAISSLVLVVLFVASGFAPKATSAWAVVPAAIVVLATVGATLLASGVMVYVRDVRHALPLVLQLGLFATPIAYGMEAVPARYRSLYSVLNPLGPSIDDLRRSVLFGTTPDWGELGLAALGATVLAVGGYLLFKRLEVGFADEA